MRTVIDDVQRIEGDGERELGSSWWTMKKLCLNLRISVVKSENA